GCGRRFTVYLPRSGEAPVQPPRELPSPQRGRQEQVMVVDDEEMLVRLGCEMLSGLGYVPVGFTSGQEALAAFHAHPERFDAVLTDARMPRLSGLELIEAVRAVRPALPVLLVSGFLGASAAQRARKAGASAVLTKPLSQREVAAALATALATRRAD
ncbi:MAG: response regulator, partial [Aquincola tertiaricarbonis]